MFGTGYPTHLDPACFHRFMAEIFWIHPVFFIHPGAFRVFFSTGVIQTFFNSAYTNELVLYPPSSFFLHVEHRCANLVFFPVQTIRFEVSIQTRSVVDWRKRIPRNSTPLSSDTTNTFVIPSKLR